MTTGECGASSITATRLQSSPVACNDSHRLDQRSTGRRRDADNWLARLGVNKSWCSSPSRQAISCCFRLDYCNALLLRAVKFWYLKTAWSEL